MDSKKTGITIPLVKLIMCPPDYMDTKTQNNIWMQEMAKKKGKDGIKVDKDKAMSQFKNMYELFTDYAIIYLIPPRPGLQDQIYTSSAGMVLPHMEDKICILPAFRANGRYGEQKEDRDFLEKLEYVCDAPPFFFEGEAECKWVRDNIYIGGFGQRSDTRVYAWMEQKYNMEIIRVEETDPHLYHLDCSVFPLDPQHIMLGNQVLLPADVKKIEKVAEVIPVSKKSAYAGICNSVRLGYTIFNCSNIEELEKGTEDYDVEKQKNIDLETICSKFGLELVFINLSEIMKSGAMMSCCILHLTYDTPKIKLGALPKPL